MIFLIKNYRDYDQTVLHININLYSLHGRAGRLHQQDIFLLNCKYTFKTKQ